jgi:hypothetical protein
MRYRKLRIAWSVVWGLAAVLLIVLWVRNYWVVDELTAPVTTQHFITSGSVPGAVAIGWGKGTRNWKIIQPLTQDWRDATGDDVPSPVWFGVTRRGGFVAVWMPSWFLILVFAMLAAAPWIRWRFSLRTVLIATTLVAVALGLIVYVVRQ